MRFFLILLASLITGCVSSGGDVGSSVETCCPKPTADTFSIEPVNLPKFLETLMVTNLSSVLSEKGLQPLDRNATLKVRLSYRQDELPMAGRFSNFDERVSEGGDVRFVARIVIEMRDEVGKLVFDGSIDRIHEVSPGEYMHTGPASVAIYDAFQSLLKDISR
ncbi:MAG: hypothetical protein HOC70_03440 [Gammaproteobacteria bacterium]|jgi:hypothetical protein|nr:hypothetical protein [Gammaproteobacteria bacterium]